MSRYYSDKEITKALLTMVKGEDEYNGTVYSWDSVVDIIIGNTDGAREQRHWDRYMLSDSDPQDVDKVLETLVNEGFLLNVQFEAGLPTPAPKDVREDIMISEQGIAKLGELNKSWRQENAPEPIRSSYVPRPAPKRRSKKFSHPGQKWNWWEKSQ